MSDLDVNGMFTSTVGHNFIGAVDGATGFGIKGDQIGSLAAPLDASLGPLQVNGGPVKTHLPLDSQGGNCCLTIDSGSSEGYLGRGTALVGEIDATQTELTVLDIANLPQFSDIAGTQYPFQMQIDDELLLVTSVQGNLLSVRRGVNGTIAAPHLDNAAMTIVVDQQGTVRTHDSDDDGNANPDIGAAEMFFSKSEKVISNWDGTESGAIGLEGWVVYIDVNDNRALDVTEPSTTSIDSGLAKLYPLVPAVSHVRVIEQQFWKESRIPDSELPNLTVLDDQFYFSQWGGFYRLDPQTGMTTQISTIGISLGSVVAFDGNLYFYGEDDPDIGGELYRYDPNTETVSLVADINPGAADSSSSHLTVFDEALYFSANDGINGQELWKYDPATDGRRPCGGNSKRALMAPLPETLCPLMATYTLRQRMVCWVLNFIVMTHLRMPLLW